MNVATTTSTEAVPAMGRRPDIHPDLERWWRGQCYPMAIALAERQDWPTACLVVHVREGDRPWREHVVHAWVRAPDGRGFDARGYFDEADLHEDFLAHTGRRWRDDRIVMSSHAVAFRAVLDDAFGSEPEWMNYVERLPGLVQQAKGAVELHLADSLDAVALSP